MLCAVQITWHSGLKQRAATAFQASFGTDTQCQMYCQDSVITLQKAIHPQSTTLCQVPTEDHISHISAQNVV